MIETLALCLIWLAHLAWYASAPREHVSLFPRATSHVIAARSGAGVLLCLGTGLWMKRYGVAVGVSCALGALTAAASFHAIVAPLSPRVVRGVASLVFVIAVAVSVGALRG